MSEQLLDLLKLCLLILLYLFFLRVMWAVFSELRAPATPPPGAATGAAAVVAPQKQVATRTGRRRSPKASPTVLRVREPESSAGQEHAITAEMTIGRAPGCTVVVDDTYASQVHARVFVDDKGRVQVEDLGSTNGTFHNGEAVDGPQVLRRGDRIQVGNTVWDVA